MVKREGRGVRKEGRGVEGGDLLVVQGGVVVMVVVVQEAGWRLPGRSVAQRFDVPNTLQVTEVPSGRTPGDT